MNKTNSDEIVRRLGWLADRPKPFQDAWLEICEPRTLAPGERVFSLADPTAGIFGVVDGFADVMIAPGFQPAILVHIARPGWWLGDAAALNTTPHRGEVTARTEMRVLYAPLLSIEALQPRFPQIWRMIGYMRYCNLMSGNLSEVCA